MALTLFGNVFAAQKIAAVGLGRINEFIVGYHIVYVFGYGAVQRAKATLVGQE